MLASGRHEAVNEFENLMTLEWHSITEPRAVEAVNKLLNLLIYDQLLGVRGLVTAFT